MARDNVLVSTDWTREHSSDDDVVLVEITEGGDNPSGRIPGAVSIDWTRDLQDPVRRDLVGPEEFSALLGRLGIEEHHTVVFYSGNNNWWAAAGYWQFRLYGHRELRMMDGGRALWEAQGGELTFDIPARRPTAYPVRPADESIRARRTDLLDGIGRTTLLDVRSLGVPRRADLAARGAPGRGGAPRPCPVGPAHPLEPDGTAGRHLSAHRGAGAALRAGGWDRSGRGLLPDRLALGTQLVRPARAARPPRRQQLRRRLAGVRRHGRRPRGPRTAPLGRSAQCGGGCPCLMSR